MRYKLKVKSEKLKVKGVRCKVLLAFFFTLYTLHFTRLVWADFEDTGSSAVPLGMAGAYTGLAKGVDAIYYNPAGISLIQKPLISTAYGRLWMGLDDESDIGKGFLGAVIPAGKFGIGLAWLNTSLLGFYQENTFLAGVAKRISQRLSVGMNLKFLSERFHQDDYTKNDLAFKDGNEIHNWSFDAACLFLFPGDFRVGIKLQDINRPKLALSSNDRIPFSYRIGVALDKEDVKYDLDIFSKEEQIKLYAGCQTRLLNLLFLRTGLGWGDPLYRSLSFGIGWGDPLSGVKIDYSFTYPLSGIADTYGSHRFSLSFGFGEKKIEEVQFKQPKGAVGIPEEVIEMPEEAIELPEEEEFVEEEFLEEIQPEIPKKPVGEKEPRPFGEEDLEETSPKERGKPLPKKEKIHPVRYRKLSNGVKFPFKYKVKSGDTLESLAKRFYGDTSFWIIIYEENKRKVKKGLLKPGEVLVLPRKEEYR